ncbi:MAG: helix-turn-helix domain-containing protein [Deltaproteobacteria bacterium]|nr:helix-turn-helix domain-containing protein [Deltaproteobacteria bacterium]
MTVQMIPRIQGQKGPLTTKRYYRVGEVAARFAISSQTVYRMIDMGDLKAIRLRGCLRVSVKELRRYEKRRRTDI